VAASVDTGEHASGIASTVSFPVAEGVTREMADALGSWWEDRRSIIQPSEFILDDAGAVRLSNYSSGAIGRIDAESAVKLISFWEKQRQQA
jgi:hypothetical protein